jgi:hypothetical protein
MKVKLLRFLMKISYYFSLLFVASYPPREDVDIVYCEKAVKQVYERFVVLFGCPLLF